MSDLDPRPSPARGMPAADPVLGDVAVLELVPIPLRVERTERRLDELEERHRETHALVLTHARMLTEHAAILVTCGQQAAETGKLSRQMRRVAEGQRQQLANTKLLRAAVANLIRVIRSPMFGLYVVIGSVLFGLLQAVITRWFQ